MNFVQRPMGSVDERPSVDDFRLAQQGFWETIAELDPALIFVFSRLVWAELPSSLPDGDPGRSGAIGASEWIWRYARRVQPSVYAVCFQHRNARNNPPSDVWRAWAEYAIGAMEKDRG